MGRSPLRLPQVISGYCVPSGPTEPYSTTVTAGVVVKVAAPVIFKGAIVLPGTVVPKLKTSALALVAVKLAQVHCFVASRMETLSAGRSPDAAAKEIALLELPPPVTPASVPLRIIVAPL